MVATEAARWEVLAPTSRSMDVRSKVRVLDEITTWKPDVVVHLAYRKDDRQVIVDGTRNVAEAAAAAGARMIHMSTDIVFAGREAPYVEADRPDATIDYGRWKGEAETVLLRAHPGALAVRTSLLYGTEMQSPGQQEVADVLAGKRSQRYFTDEVRCPAHAADVAAAIIVLADQQGSGVLHIAGPHAVSRAELAQAFAEWMGADRRTVPTASLAETGIQRPAHVVLDTSLAAGFGIRCRSLAETLTR
jgi:dTDP-4-dehydrorhamnose reductase